MKDLVNMLVGIIIATIIAALFYIAVTACLFFTG